uniref:Carboxylesterase 3 n=1 Tax=Neogobius melanostomus TaxID=47308 RepID=A0A8C6UT95_9GOBI
MVLLSAAGINDPVVSLKNGRIRGELVTVRGTDRKVKQFLGIPFAHPPVGPLRLAAPQEALPWDEEKDCTKQPSMCIQDPQIMVNVSKSMSMQITLSDISEDCLYLNVYTPESAMQGDKLPVMVWIHGGGLTVGAASHYDGSSLAAYENVVMVIIQYRLGILGFLSTGDEHATGNWGFLDQLLALRWVQDNIEVFGGDPRVIICVCVEQSLSPLAKDLFQKAIFQSGVAVLAVMNMFYPTGVRIHNYKTSLSFSFFVFRHLLLYHKASSANSLIAEEYLGNAQSPEEVRDRFTEVIGDLLMTLPVVGVAGYLSG